MNFKKVALLMIFLQMSFCSFAQILDDSTKQVFSFKTTKYFLEEDLLNNHKTLYTPDTSIQTFHQSNFILRNNWLYQDLGGLGTANKYVFYTPVQDIGTQLGYHVYSNYAFDAARTPYYDTKSPYTNIFYVQGANGQDNIRFTYARNISKQWNIGFDVNRQNGTKQLATTTTTNLVDSWSFMLFSSYESKNKKYQILGNYNHFNHHVLDQGGIRPKIARQNSPDSLLNYASEIVNLNGASSREKWNNLHIYQQFVAFNGLQFFNTIDYKILADTYYDNKYLADSTIKYVYKNTTPSTLDSIYQWTNFHLLDTKIGLKGFYKGFNYRLHLRYRNYSNRTEWKPLSTENTVNKISGKNEVILGAWASYYFPDSVRKVFGEMEFNPANLTISWRAEYFSNFLKLGFYQIVSPPTLIQNNFYGNVYQWTNNFTKLPTSTNLYANLDYKIGRFRLQPSGNYSIVSNYIYFNENAIATQNLGEINILRLGFAAEYNFRKLLIFNRLDFATTDKEEIIRMPKFSINTRIGYEFVYSKALHINAGLEVYYKTAYNADNYMPLTQQFYLNNKTLADGVTPFTVWGKPVVDAYADFRVRKVRVFLKMSYLNQGLIGKGYFTTPYYTGLQRGFTLGVNWPMFD